MKIEKRNWTINLGGPNRGKDIERELTIREFKSNFNQLMDAYTKGDNQTLELPLSVNGKPLDTHFLAAKDVDPTPGRIRADLSEGTIEKNEKANPYSDYKNLSETKAVVEFDPESRQTQRYSATTPKIAFDASFQEGELAGIVSEKHDGSYRETLTFSNDGKTVIFESEEKVADDAEPKVKGEWFLAMA